MEFKEFSNPEKEDYDINSSTDESITSNTVSNANIYVSQLIDLIGFIEDVTDEELQQEYGININEYFNPTALTITKVSKTLNNKSNVKHR